MDFATARTLVRAATLGIDDLERAIAAAGACPAVDFLLDEIRPRLRLSELSEFDQDTIVRLCLQAGAETVHRDLVVRRNGSGWAFGPSGEHPVAAAAVITQDLAEALRGTVSPSGASAATRSVQWRDADDFTAFHSPPAAFRVVQRLLAAMERRDDRDLSALAAHHGSDKWGLHNYTPHYQRHFEPLRDQPIVLLEIGVGGYQDPTGGGASLRMWRDFFPRALVYGLDVVDKSAHDEGRIRTLLADQADPGSLSRAVEPIGRPDIIIDDGSHINKHVLSTFRALFPLLRPGGKYVIEDLQTAYWPSFGGSEQSTCDPHTTIGLLKDLVDGLNHQELTERNPRSSSTTDTQIAGVHFHHNLAVLDKGLNLEPGAPSWLARTQPES